MSNRNFIQVPVEVEEPKSDFDEWQSDGTFDAKEITYRMELLPAPAHAKRVEIRNFNTGRAEVGYRVSCGCPHCMKDVEFIHVRGYSEEVMSKIDGHKKEVDALKLEIELLKSWINKVEREKAVLAEALLATMGDSN